MNKLFTYLCILLFAVVSAIVFPACGSDEEELNLTATDIPNFSIRILVKSENGDNLFDPAFEGNLLNSNINAVYKEKTYQLKDIQSIYPSRLVGLYYFGLFYGEKVEDKYVLTFGEFSGDVPYENGSVVIQWEDGTEDVITFSSKQVRGKKGTTIYRSFSLNGEFVTDELFPLLEIVK